MLSVHRLVLVPCKLSMPQEVGVCILSMTFIAPAICHIYNRQVAPATTGPGALTGAGHMLNGKTQGVQAIHTSGMYS